MEYGYCRISTPKQSIDRQVRNILKSYPNAHIVKEVYTGTKFQGRKEFEKILKNMGIEVTVRREMGSDINAACGQLRRSYLK